MEQSYAEANVKRKTKIGTIILQVVLTAIVVLLLVISAFVRLVMIVAIVAAAALLWYWPRFRVEWEYVFCDGQLDFDMIQGGERRKHVLRIEIENADVIAPLESSRLDGYRHLAVRDYSSQKSEAKLYGVATRLPDMEEKLLILFEPSERMVEMMYAKCPNIVETAKYIR